jgi:glycosyltransferase involved in cell wall biosynthesis
LRIAILNWSRRKAGGVEVYLNGIIPALFFIGHEVAFWHETDGPSHRELISVPDKMQSWCVSDLGAERALAALRDWEPDLIYTHILESVELEAETLRIAPAIFFAHAYYGTCISGAKTFKNPTAMPCNRRFGWQCLLHYYPHHCGGWNPLTMLREYQRQSKRLELLPDYKAIITNSNHLRDEYINHGLSADRIYSLPFHVARLDDDVYSGQKLETLDGLTSANRESVADSSLQMPCWRLLFIGRMDFLKGGQVFLDSLLKAGNSLDRPLRVTFIGDGPDRHLWERQAMRAQLQNQGLKIEFLGWLNSSQLAPLLDNFDLLVVPSLWPEPFGMVGVEAGMRGVPAAAFAVGGITSWLTNGVNGHLAPGDPPTAEGLAEAIVKCLRDPAKHAELRSKAAELARRFSLDNHLKALLPIFEEASISRESFNSV